MKFLTPEIEALSKQYVKGKSLAKPSTSCGIFQDCNPLEDQSKLYENYRELRH